MTKNWKVPISLTLAVVVCTVPACDQYALLGLNPDGTSANSNSSTGSSAGGGGQNSNSNANSNQNTNSAANANSNAASEITGEVDRVLCDTFIVINQDGAAANPIAFEVTNSGNVGDWADAHAVAFDDAANQLANLDLNVDVSVERVGAYETTSQLVIHNAGALTLQLQDGSLWIYEVTDTTEVDQWRPRQDNIAVITQASGNARLVNLRRCESIVALPL